MIKLILAPNTQPITYLFDKDRIVIGGADGGESQPDLPLSLSNLQSEHVCIEELDGIYIAFNLANDPFTTINGHSFRKKLLKIGDFIEIASITIKFEGNCDHENDEKSPLLNALEKKIDRAPSVVSKANIASDDPLENLDIDALLKRVEDLEAAFIARQNHRSSVENKCASLSPTPSNAVISVSPTETDIEEGENFTPPPRAIEFSANKPRKSLKDDYLRHLDDDADANTKSKDLSTPRMVISWKSLSAIVGGFLLFFCAAFAIFYVSTVDRSQKEELKVAAAVSDVAMALNFAYINHASPQNHNWSDPDFLKHNLAAVLASGHIPLANIDSHGQFVDTSYILRIYTSSDLSHFLVIAQPNASLLQWLVPKAAIIVDSQSMELRKNADLRALNRLLIDPTIDSSNSREISQLVNQAEQISIDSLAKVQRDSGFSSAKALAYIRPGAENYIYNALRYYHFGELLTKKAIALYQARDNEHDISLLMQEIEILKRLKNIVLYSTGGLRAALNAQRAIAAFSPQHKFLFGYLQFNQQGLAHGGHLLIDDGNSEIAALDTPVKPDSKIVAQDNAFDDLMTELYETRDNTRRETELKIEQLINEISLSDDPAFAESLQTLKNELDKIDQKHQQRIFRALSLLALLSMNDEKSDDNQIDEIQPTDLIPQKDDLESKVSFEPESQNSSENDSSNTINSFNHEVFLSLIEKIRESKSLREVENASQALANLLSIEYIFEVEQFIAYQNVVHAEVVEKLDYFLLSPQQPLDPAELHEANRAVLSQILTNAWVYDEDECDYYLNEFTLLCH